MLSNGKDRLRRHADRSWSACADTHQLLGDLAAEAEGWDSALEEYEQALKLLSACPDVKARPHGMQPELLHRGGACAVHEFARAGHQHLCGGVTSVQRRRHVVQLSLLGKAPQALVLLVQCV